MKFSVTYPLVTHQYNPEFPDPWDAKIWAAATRAIVPYVQRPQTHPESFKIIMADHHGDLQ